MIELDGIQYNINTPEENANQLVTIINDYCTSKNIRNRKDELIQIEANNANPLYIILLGVGYLGSVLQRLIYSAGCAVNIAFASPRQLLNLADLAGIKRKEPTRTTILATVYSNLQESGAVPCVITTALSASIPINNQTVVFHPAFDITIPIGSSATVILVADSLGSYSISENVITSFDENPTGFRAMLTEKSVPGQDQESIADLRVRIQRRTESGTMQDKASDAISQLDGVSVCNVYFNESILDTETVRGIQVPPRQAAVFVQGWSNKIAETFYSYMTCQCAGEGTQHATTQTFVTRSGQVLKVPVITPELIGVHIRIYFNQRVDDDTKEAMIDTISTLARHRTIGQLLTSTEIVDILQENFASYAPAGCDLSLDNLSFSYQVQPSQYQLITFDHDKVLIQGV